MTCKQFSPHLVCLIAGVVLTVLVSCTPLSTLANKKGTVMSNETCKHALSGFASKDFAAWEGLPSSCTLSDVESLWPLETNAHHTVQGAGQHTTYRRYANVSGFVEPVVVSYRDKQVVQLSTLFPELSDVSNVLAKLGEPELKLDCYLMSIPKLNEGGEWVYPSKGLAFRMSTNHKNVVQVMVYPPTDAAGYKEHHYTLVAPRELD